MNDDGRNNKIKELITTLVLKRANSAERFLIFCKSIRYVSINNFSIQYGWHLEKVKNQHMNTILRYENLFIYV